MSDPSAPSPRRRAWASRALLALGGLLLALLLVEGGLRVYTWAYITRRLAPLTLPAEGGGLVYVLGDSVPYGYGIAPEQAWPAQLREKIKGEGYEVYNASEPGASLMGLRLHQLTALQQVRPGVPVIALFQVGHNDRTTLMLHGKATEEDQREIAPIWSEMRLMRLYRSFEERRRRFAPPERISDAGREQFARDLGRICQVFEDRGGTCIIMTYPLCGVMGQEHESWQAMGYNRTYAAQLTVNQLIRWTASRLALPLLDVAMEVPLSLTWDPEECIDAVHVTGPVHARIASLVADKLED